VLSGLEQRLVVSAAPEAIRRRSVMPGQRGRSILTREAGQPFAGRRAAEPGSRAAAPAPKETEADVPKYAVVRSYLEELISAELKPGDPIPSERALATRFGVARMTVRHAVDRLVTEGRLRRVRPIGTFVTVPDEPPLAVTSHVTEAIEARGRRHRYQVIGRYTIAASEDVASALQLGVGERVHVVRRVRLAGEEPLAVESVHIPASLTPSRDDPRVADQHVDEVLERRYGVVVDEVKQVVEAAILPSGSARMLEVPAQSPGLILRRRSFSGGTPVAFSVATYRADRCKLHLDFPKTADFPVAAGRPAR
jgi:GntR family transcriptional regulator